MKKTEIGTKGYDDFFFTNTPPINNIIEKLKLFLNIMHKIPNNTHNTNRKEE